MLPVGFPGPGEPGGALSGWNQLQLCGSREALQAHGQPVWGGEDRRCPGSALCHSQVIPNGFFFLKERSSFSARYPQTPVPAFQLQTCPLLCPGWDWCCLGQHKHRQGLFTGDVFMAVCDGNPFISSAHNFPLVPLRWPITSRTSLYRTSRPLLFPSRRNSTPRQTRLLVFTQRFVLESVNVAVIDVA